MAAPLPASGANAVLYLDHHGTGFDYPVLPFPINCYGRRVVSYRGSWRPSTTSGSSTRRRRIRRG